VASDQCESAALGLSSRSCQRCGSPGLDDFCRQNSYGTSRCNYPSGPPYGYLYSSSTTGTVTTLPASCTQIQTAASRVGVVIPFTNTAQSVYIDASSSGWSEQYPKAYVNPSLYRAWSYLTMNDCLNNNLPIGNTYLNGVWNRPYTRSQFSYDRYDSYTFLDTATQNYTWSYQCYCDWCNSCQSCTNG